MKAKIWSQGLLVVGASFALGSPCLAQVSSALLALPAGDVGVLGAGMGALKQGAVSAANNGGVAIGATGGKTGTFTLSASEGTNQNFAVGTSTNLGINASASSTSEYEVRSAATLGAGSSNIRQVIGTSGVATTDSQREQQKADYASQAVKSTLGTTSSEYFDKKSTEISTSGSSTQTNGNAWWNNLSAAGKTATSYDALTSEDKSKVDTAYKADVTSLKTTSAANYEASSASTEASNGIVRGTFEATQKSSLSDSSGNKLTPAQVASASSASSDVVKTNDVTVQGIGNSANLNAQANTNFSTEVKARSTVTAPVSNSATANGGAGANMSTNSTANASNSSFSSVFLQSF